MNHRRGNLSSQEADPHLQRKVGGLLSVTRSCSQNFDERGPNKRPRKSAILDLSVPSLVGQRNHNSVLTICYDRNRHRLFCRFLSNQESTNIIVKIRSAASENKPQLRRPGCLAGLAFLRRTSGLNSGRSSPAASQASFASHCEGKPQKIESRECCKGAADGTPPHSKLAQ